METCCSDKNNLKFSVLRPMTLSDGNIVEDLDKAVKFARNNS